MNCTRFFTAAKYTWWIAIPLVLAGCHRESGVSAPNTVPGLPLNRYFESSSTILLGLDSEARRYDTANGPKTDIWVSGVPLDDEQRSLFQSKPSVGLEISSLHAPGILIRIDDEGAKVDSFVVCESSSATTATCAASDVGVVVVSRFEARGIRGAFFTDSTNHEQRYALQFDASLLNTSSTAIKGMDAWSNDSDEATATFSKMMKAAATKDADSLRSLSVPERQHDWEHFGIINAIQRTANQDPRVIAALRQGAVVRLWVLPTTGDGAARLPFRVDMENFGSQWRFARMVY
jgi:hypothetical protein